MKKIVLVLSVLVFALSLCACSEKESLSGTYESESGVYQVVFSEDGTCTWTDNGVSYEGTYVQEEDYWKLYFDGYKDLPEEVMDVQVYVREEGYLDSYSMDFMEKLYEVE